MARNDRSPGRLGRRAALLAIAAGAGGAARVTAELVERSIHTLYVPVVRSGPGPTATRTRAPTATPTSGAPLTWPPATPTAAATAGPGPTAGPTAPGCATGFAAEAPTPAQPVVANLDAPILGPASGSVEQAVAWLTPRTSGYDAAALREIAGGYRDVGDAVGIDWFLAMAQCCHETGHLTSFWSQRPQRNPAGIGVTGQWQCAQPSYLAGWALNTQRNRWERGISFGSWVGEAIPAHLGRLLAYALTDAQAAPIQRELIAYALSVRSLPADRRGIAPTIVGLNGSWAVPGTSYGQTIVFLRDQMHA